MRSKMEQKLFNVWYDTDTSNATSSPVNEPPERVAFGGHEPIYSGTQSQVNRFLARLRRKPYLIEKYLPVEKGGVR